MVKNLSEVLQEILGHCRAEIRQGEAPLPQLEKAGEEPTRPLPTPATCEPRTPAHVKQVHQARQASRDDRYTQMTTLRAQGLTQSEVAKRMGMSERAVRHWLKRGAAPTNERQFRRRSVFDPYAAYVLERWQDGIHEAKQLYAEIRAQGFPGTVRIVQRFVQALRDDPEKMPLAPATGADRFSSKTATWLFIRDPKQLTAKKQAELELICQRSETARKTYELTQQFMRMLRLRRGQELERWLSAVEASQIPELRRFAQGLLKDKSAVVAGLTLSVSQWASRGSGAEAQIGQAFDVWPRQTASVTATFAPCGLICTETFASQLSSSVSYFSSHLTPRQFKQVCRLPPLFVIRSKQAHLFWGRARIIISQQLPYFGCFGPGRRLPTSGGGLASCASSSASNCWTLRYSLPAGARKR